MNTIRAFLYLLVFACLVLSGCGGGGGSSSPSPPPPPPPPPDEPDEPDDPPEPTLTWIQDNVFTPICTQCHVGAGAPEGLRLEEGLSFGMLVDVESNQVPELMRVDPGNPDDSYIIHKLEGTQDVGDRMPQGGPFLSQGTIDIIRQWIEDGAMDNAPPPPMFADGMHFSQPPPTMTGGWPVDGSTVGGSPPGHIVLIASTELDTTLIHSGSVQVTRFDDAGGTVLPAQIHVTSLAPTVLKLQVPEHHWTPGHYEVRVLGTGTAPVADRWGHLIDGNADGIPGGDFVVRFEFERTQ